MGMAREISREVRSVMGRSGVADAILPPVVFVVVDAWTGLALASGAGLATALLIVGVRLIRRRSARFALSGLLGTGVAVAFALRSGRSEAYFLPGIVSGAITTLAILVSIALRRPAVAWTSWITRGWPIEWYWHPNVRPAYTFTSWLWAAFFGIRASVQGWLYLQGDTTALGIVRVLTGWPGVFALLIATYVLGRNRLTALAGPSIGEFEQSKPPPWTGQPTGF